MAVLFGISNTLFYSRVYHDDIDELRHSVHKIQGDKIETYLREQENPVASFADPEDEVDYKYILDNCIEQAAVVRQLCDELCIVGLYRKLEIQTNRMAGLTLTNLKESEDDLIRNKAKKIKDGQSIFSKLKEFLDCLNTKESNLYGFQAVTELRLLNNCVKHSGRVSSKLNNTNPTWQTGEPLRGLDEAYVRLLPEVKKFMKEFGDLLLAKNDNSAS